MWAWPRRSLTTFTATPSLKQVAVRMPEIMKSQRRDVGGGDEALERAEQRVGERTKDEQVDLVHRLGRDLAAVDR